MKYWIHFLIVLLAGLLLSLMLPWWIVGILALLSAYFYRLRFWLSGLYGLLGGFLLWGLAAFYMDIENDQILSSRIGDMFGGLSPILLVLITALLGGLIAALGSMAGSSIREIVAEKK